MIYQGVAIFWFSNFNNVKDFIMNKHVLNNIFKALLNFTIKENLRSMKLLLKM
jgi:hypothetical protein